MEAAFLLIAAKPGRRPSGHHRAVAGRADTPALGFDADDHLLWSDDAGSLIVGAWQRGSDEEPGSRYHVGKRGIAVSVGQMRWRGRRWPAEREWAAQLAKAVRSTPLAEVAEQLDGVFGAVVAAPDGRATVLGDPLGNRCLYYGESSDAFVVSSRASLTALALADSGAPRKDLWGTCGLAYAGYLVGDRTGFEGVRVLGGDGRVEIRPNVAPTVETRGAPWFPDEPTRSLNRDALLEMVRSDVAESLRAYLTYPAASHVLGLTGGRDSRLLLAVMLSEGLAGEYRFVTIGPPALDDVRVASALATRFGLDHHVEFPQPAAKRAYDETIRSFVAATAGTVNVLDLHGLATPSTEVRITGLGGETLRNFHLIPEGWRGKRLLRRLPKLTGYGRLGVVRPEAAARYEGELIDALLDDPSGGSSPLDLFGALLVRNRARSARLGPSEEVLPGRRVVPLCSVDAVRAAFAVGGERRQAHFVHFEVMRRCSDELARLPFAGKSWPEELAAYCPGVADYRTGVPLAGSESGGSGEPLMARIMRKEFDERGPVLRSVFEHRDNPAWELIDPAIALDALDRFDELRGPERRQLFGAVTAALWLDDRSPS